MAGTRTPGATTPPTDAAPASGATPEGVVGQATEAVRHVAESASELAQDTYDGVRVTSAADWTATRRRAATSAKARRP
jgi:hypothetical protein